MPARPSALACDLSALNGGPDGSGRLPVGGVATGDRRTSLERGSPAGDRTDDWPVFLPHFTRLRRLNASGVSSFGDGGLAALGSTVGPRLAHLDVADTAVSAAGIRTIIVAPDADGCSSFAWLTHLRFGWHEETRWRVARSWSEERRSLLSALLRSLARSLVAPVGQGEFDRDGGDDAISVVPDCPHLRTIDLTCESTSLDWDAPCAHVLDVGSSYSLLAFVRSAPPIVRHLRVLKLNQAEKKSSPCSPRNAPIYAS